MRSFKEISASVVIILLLVYGFFCRRQSLARNNDLQIQEDGIVSINVTSLTPLINSLATPTPSLGPQGISFPSTTNSFKVDTISVTPFQSTKSTRSLPVQSRSACKSWLTGRIPNDGRWYNFSTPELTIYAYTAFVDDRPSLKIDPVVRIIAVADKIEEMAIKPRMFCRFYYPKGEENIIITTENHSATFQTGNAKMSIRDVEVEMNPVRKIGMGWQLNSRIAREYIFTCPLPSSKQLMFPSSLGILIGESSQNHIDVTACLPVERPPKPAVKKDFVLCVQVAFGQIDTIRLIEWLELQLLLGVESIGIYDQGIHEPAMVVLRHYAELGFVDLRRSDYIPDGPKQYLLHGSPVINDCMFRNLHAFRHMMVFDIDEVIMPKITNLTDGANRTPYKILMDNMEKKYGKGSFQYSFRNSYFFFEFPVDTKEPKEFAFLRHKHTAPISERGYSTKSIIDQQTCIQMHNHYCWGNTKEFDHIPPIDVDTTLGKNHHYKKCHFSELECKNMLGKSTYDDTILAYKNELLKRVKFRIEEIRTKMKRLNMKDFLANSFKGS